MTAPADICNMALSDIGARATIAALTDPGPAAVACNIWYDKLRQMLLRTAPWGFARSTIALTQLGAITNTPPDNIYPFPYKYAYPSDCIKFRYLLPPPTQPITGAIVPPTTGNSAPLICAPWALPSRHRRWLPSNEKYQQGGQGAILNRTVLLATEAQAYGVYTQDISDPDLFDIGFEQALVAALSSKLVMPITGKTTMKKDYEQIAELRISQARADDGNEAMPTTDHVPDWIRARGSQSFAIQDTPLNGLGFYMCSWDDMSWGM